MRFFFCTFISSKGCVTGPSASDVVADFHLGKDLLYAELNLKDSRTKALFRELYERLAESIPSVAVMVYLSASSDLLLQRIRARNRDFELEIDPEYYRLLNAAYEEYFTIYPGKKLRVPMDEWDFVNDPQLYERLTALVNGELHTK